MIALLLLLQIASSPCPPSLACTLPALQTAPPVTVAADPGRPAKWFTAALLIEVAAFDGWALAEHENTISHLAQRESRAHSSVRWLGVASMALLTWHLFLGGFPW